MQTIAQAFEAFLQTLELSENERSEASRQHTNMRTELQKRLDVVESSLSGSYARHTAIRPLNDIDIFLVLRDTAALSPRSTPHAILTTIKRTLESIYPGKTSTPQARSINIEFSTTGIAYDVVPAFLLESDVYSIPDADARSWVNTNPKIHKELSTKANEDAGKTLKPLLKAVKHAKNFHGAPARSFHLEVLSWSVLRSAPPNYMDGLNTLLTGLAAHICEPCPDPAGLGPDIRPSTERCREAQLWLRRMAALASEARTLAKDGKLGEAHATMRDLFGPQWPEKGKRRSGAGAVIVGGGGGSVDHSGSRFG